MTRRHAWLIAGVIVFVAASAWFFSGRTQDQLVVDLVKEFPGAKKQPAPSVFSIIDGVIGHETKPAIFVAMASRLTYPHVVIPENAWLRVSLGVKEEAWTTPNDGVSFMIMVSDGKSPEAVLTRELNPFEVSADRRWRDELIDLSDYAGETVELIFNTRAGPRNETNGDLALWGAPRLVVR